MTMNTIIEDLKEIRYLRREIEGDAERIARLQSALESVVKPLQRIRGGRTFEDRLSGKVAKVLDMQEKLLWKVMVCEGRIEAVEKELDVLPHHMSIVMRMRYFDDMEWLQIAETLHYSMRWCTHLHRRALDRLEDH